MKYIVLFTINNQPWKSKMYIVGIWDDVITIKSLNRDCNAKKTQHSFNNQPNKLKMYITHCVYYIHIIPV